MLKNTKLDSKKQKKLLSVPKKESTSLCGLCRGTKLLCGRSRCPVLVKFHSRDKVTPLIDKLSLGGSSPPSVFIGRFGYPKVSIGPMIPPVMGDTSLIDTPELWLDKSIDDIVDFRSMLIRGTYNVDVFDVENPNKIVGFTRELALSKNSVFTEAIFDKKPRGRIAFYDSAQPHGPSAPLKKFDITNPKYEQHIEKAFYDTDLKARSAVLDLYRDGVKISKIQRAFSVGAFGINKYRRFVPTRWSITAVDSMLGKELMKKTKTRPYINEFRIYYLNQFDNRWIVLMMPSEWQYELIEAWYPNTTWNPYGSSISMFNSYEFFYIRMSNIQQCNMSTPTLAAGHDGLGTLVENSQETHDTGGFAAFGKSVPFWAEFRNIETDTPAHLADNSILSQRLINRLQRILYIDGKTVVVIFHRARRPCVGQNTARRNETT